MNDFSFNALTPDLILDAIEALEIYPTTGLLALNSYENRVYQFGAEDGKRYVVKFYRPARWTDEQILEEHEFALAAKEAEVPVVAPLLITGRSLHFHEGYRYTLFPSVGGRQFELDNLDHLEILGRYLGRLHCLSAERAFEYRPELNTQRFFVDAQQALLKSQLVPSHLHTPFVTILEQVINKAASKYRVAKTLRLHGDCHAGNLLWSRDQLMLVDLDDCQQGPAIQDLWMMLNGDRNEQLVQLDTLLTGYEEFMSFDSKELALIEPLRAMRMVNYMAWLAQRWQDPAFERNFSWFATDKYWEQQILALKEQFAALDEPSLSLFP
ncbi:serine/threonine protein kinase [Pseudoalteromonas piscicida]|uniref:serine/threonine protein kinase n=1 Tax=Pseudoalteromonas piscicida TaxID=43662 RepID=UPI000E35AD7E|nr:serine/threonine protein kinase [Pseudoalteromonas piscicida]AXQ99274.1 serine/threonine protein kinase [Pseudoalteromonas piscicida]